MNPSYYRVIITLLDHAHGDGTGAHPSIDTLAAECCLSVDTVKDALSFARKHRGIIQVRRGRKNVGPSVYRFPQQWGFSPIDKNLNGGDLPKNAGSQWGAFSTANISINNDVEDSRLVGSGGSKQACDPWEVAAVPHVVEGVGSGSLRSQAYQSHQEDDDDDHRPLDSSDKAVPPSFDTTADTNLDSPHGKTSALPSPSNDDRWPKDVDSAPCANCGEAVYLGDEYGYRGYLKWHKSCHSSISGNQ